MLEVELIFLIPLIGILLSLVTYPISSKFTMSVTTIAISLSTIFSWYKFFRAFNITDISMLFSSDGYKGFESQTIKLFNIFNFETLKADWVIHLDALTLIMLCVITTVSMVVHIYSIGYMAEDKSKKRFFIYLSMFTSFMILLVTSDNFLQLFVGWEGVGVSSYLLIGFWYFKESANRASIKAFVVNRVADLFFLVGIFTIALEFNTLQFSELFSKLAEGNTSDITLMIIAGSLFIGAMGKSAQFILHVWLPDAMEGPTPVSALIHAATMVTAGIFLIVRCSPLFELVPAINDAMLYIGAMTAFFAGTVALVQNDIKKTIAYSTCSQLGYMFMACGAHTYNIAIFHLMTHAFFKALLFLGAGNVIHAVHHEQDMRKMGGLWKKLPLTHVFFLIGTLAITGIYPFAGYYSKDLIIEAIYSLNTQSLIYLTSVFVAFLTSIYSWRLMFMVFYGKSRSDKADHIHKLPFVSMELPLMILAFFAIIIGFWAEHIWHFTDINFWNGTNVISRTLSEGHLPMNPMIFSFIGFIICFILYGIKQIKIKGKVHLNQIIANIISVIVIIVLLKQEYPDETNFYYTIALILFMIFLRPLLVKFCQKAWYFNELYQIIFICPTKLLAKIFACFDIKIIDYILVKFNINNVKCFSSSAVKIQTGYVYHYVFYILLGMVTILTSYLWFSIKF
ncbi:MAG: NADH-quinone oxidoreductase subunit L [Anaplasmataceae bacterium]|nr:NADH-quinone oxidoreductase subunit L [Anaplasmataceae bacterium]